METPSSTRRVTRSQTKKMAEGERNANNNSMQRIGEMRNHKKALVDITNDSPIVGLAKAQFLKTPFSEKSKKKVDCKIMGSGESLLRGQVKTLLEKVEENTNLSRIFPENVALNPLMNIPSQNVFENQCIGLASATPSLFGNEVEISKMGNGKFEEKKDFVTRSLIFDFMEKLDEYDSSAEIKEKKKTSDVNELCVEMSKMNIVKEVTQKAGKHSRFVYDSDGELIDVEEEWFVASPALILKGLPKPEGKHIRFHDQD
ncbi:hypothetical protein LIER_27073 [Lithospermum erythrorhizon]|uniref:Uncharacterized protein n=1 Tax=Lithospermum erythrorhizon TaxID=34254 RepID=A0AAV3RAR2_LITER